MITTGEETEDATWLQGTILEDTGRYGEYRADTGVYWSILEYTGVYWNILEYTGVYWSIREYIGVYWNILEHIEAYCILSLFCVGLTGMFPAHLCWRPDVSYYTQDVTGTGTKLGREVEKYAKVRLTAE